VGELSHGGGKECAKGEGGRLSHSRAEDESESRKKVNRGKRKMFRHKEEEKIMALRFLSGDGGP